MLTTSSLGRPNHSPRGAETEGTPNAPERASGEAGPGTPEQASGDAGPANRTTDASVNTGPSAPVNWRAGVPIEVDHTFYLRHGKRVVDVVASALALILLSPLFLTLVVAIKVDSSGPVLYRSTRVGKGGKTFTFYKLRSMIRGAEQYRHRIAHLNEVTGPVFKIARDPRITRVGRFLRRTSLDELPQILNILKGDMTLVGPRPPLPQEVQQYEPWQLRRLSIQPGLTCLWQISGRSRLSFDEWMRLDMEYIARRGFALDLKILIRTIPAVLSGKGAY